jgi:hypothetical protein
MTEWQFWLAMLLGLPLIAMVAVLMYAGGLIGLAVYHDKKGTRK